MIFRKLLPLCVTALLCFSSVQAVEEGERVPIYTRPLTPDQQLVQKEQREKQDRELEQNPPSREGPEEDRTRDRAYPHWVFAVAPSGDIVEIEDGSQWRVRWEEAGFCMNWYTRHTIRIRPNRESGTLYTYLLDNLTTGICVRANLTTGPYYNGPYTHWAVAIDYRGGYLFLEDGTRWSISSWDSNIYNNPARPWLPQDTIIIGTNDDGLSYWNPYILINGTIGGYVRASQG